MPLSSGVPWWGAILIALVSVLASLAALYLKTFLDRANSGREARRLAYHRFLAATEVVILRSLAFDRQRSLRYAFSRSIPILQKALLMSILLSLFRRSKHWNHDDFRIFADSIPTPVEPQDTMNDRAVLNSVEELVRAFVDVKVSGTMQAISAAGDLLDAAKQLGAELERPSLRSQSATRQIQLAELRHLVLEKQHNFVEVVRTDRQ